MVWDADLRFTEQGWRLHEFVGTRWNRVKKPERQRYLENAYRVLLTRARQGKVIVVPPGDSSDSTRPPKIYDQIFRYLERTGVRCLSNDA